MPKFVKIALLLLILIIVTVGGVLIGGYGQFGEGEETSLCTNPLSWTVDEEMVTAQLSQGAVAITVPYNIDFSKENTPLGVAFDSLEAPIAKHTWAQCRNGALFVADQKGTVFDAMATGGQKNYHGLDYALFYMDIRNNAKQRVAAFLQSPVNPDE